MLLLDFCCSHNDCSYLCYHQNQTFKTRYRYEILTLTNIT